MAVGAVFRWELQGAARASISAVNPVLVLSLVGGPASRPASLTPKCRERADMTVQSVACSSQGFGVPATWGFAPADEAVFRWELQGKAVTRPRRRCGLQGGRMEDASGGRMKDGGYAVLLSYFRHRSSAIRHPPPFHVRCGVWGQRGTVGTGGAATAGVATGVRRWRDSARVTLLGCGCGKAPGAWTGCPRTGCFHVLSCFVVVGSAVTYSPTPSRVQYHRRGRA